MSANLDDFHTLPLFPSYQGTPNQNQKHTAPTTDPLQSVLAQGKGFSFQLPGVLQEANQRFKASDRFDDFGEVAGEPQKLRTFEGEGGRVMCLDQSCIIVLNSHLHLNIAQTKLNKNDTVCQNQKENHAFFSVCQYNQSWNRSRQTENSFYSWHTNTDISQYHINSGYYILEK